MDLSEDQTTGPLSEEAQEHFDHGIWFLLNSWPALSLAVSSNWGAGNGASSDTKRDWFAGAISTLFDDRPETDLEDVETVLLQVMVDEFDVNVDDDSGYEVAQGVMRIRSSCAKGDYSEVAKLKERWEQSGKGANAKGMFKDAGEEANETDGSEDEESNDDVEMGDAPQLVERAPKEKAAPEIDEMDSKRLRKRGDAQF